MGSAFQAGERPKLVVPREVVAEAIEDGLTRAAHLPRWIDATVNLLGGDERYGVHIVRGTPRLMRHAHGKPTLTIAADPDMLARVADGRASGIDAFLDGRLSVRGNLALSLRVAGMWPQPGPVGAQGGTRIATGDVQALGLRSFYLEAGTGPAVILLHGLGATNASMLPTLRDLARDHRVIAPDLPGFGDTGKPLRPLHAAFFAQWLRAFMDALDVERADLVGNSMGGRIAIEMGLRHPDRVRNLAMLCPSPAFLRGREWARVVRLLRPELAFVPLPMRHTAVVRGIRSMFSRPERLRPEWYAAGADEFLRVFANPRGRICFFSAARQIYLEEPHRPPGGFWARLPDLQAPALFVWGDRDTLVPARFARHVERALPSAESVVLHDSGHVPQFEHPEKTHQLLRRFLEHHP